MIQTNDVDIMLGDGEMAALIREQDWDDHPLGPMTQWPQSLKISLQMILHSGYPMFIWWGPDLISFHNDAYLPVLGKKHPEALGKSARDVWAEVWGDVGDMADGVMRGESTSVEDLELYLERHGYAEETYWTFSYSPIFTTNGEVGGLFCACNEETRKILQQRRFQTLLGISSLRTLNMSVNDLLTRVADILQANRDDIPFGALYLVNEDMDKAELHTSFGLTGENKLFEEEIHLGGRSALGWDFRQILSSQQVSLYRKSLKKDFGHVLKEKNLNVEEVVLVPIRKAGENRTAGVFVGGISPYLNFDKEYSDFYKMVAANISSAKADLRAHEILQEKAEALTEADHAKSIALQNLQRGQERLHNMIMQTPIAMGILAGPDFEVEIMNKAGQNLLGRTESQLLHRPLLEAVPEFEGQAVHQKIQQAYSSGKTFKTNEYPIILRKDGRPEQLYFTMVLEPLHDLDGQITGLLAVAIDESAQVAARQMLEKREEYFRTMANDVPVMIWMTDEVGNCTYLNDQWKNFTGQKGNSGLGAGWLDAIHPDDHTNAEKLFSTAIDNLDNVEITYRLKGADGQYRWHIDTGSPRFDSFGRLEGFTGAVVDIHERKVAEDALRERENELSSAIKATNLGTWVYYPETGAVNWSERSRELFGMEPDKYVDYDVFLAHLHPDDRERTDTAVRRALDPEIREAYIIEYRSISENDGQIRWLRASGESYFNENGKAEVLIGTLLDITESKSLERQKDDFLAIASHELKTPVTTIKGYVQMMSEDLSEDNSEDMPDQLKIIDRQVDKLIFLINDLLDVGKVDTGELQMSKAVFNLDELLLEVVDSIQHMAPDHQIELTGETSKTIYGDRLRIEQVIVNLITNAIKFSPGKDRVKVMVHIENGMVRISIQDFGIGIEQKKVNQIFQRFYRDEETSKWSTGLGLGLFISAAIVKRHKGSIEVESVPDLGSVFHVLLPTHN